jgi:deoxyuridine 5'-triphosphate nucleotidohydrolase
MVTKSNENLIKVDKPTLKSLDKRLFDIENTFFNKELVECGDTIDSTNKVVRVKILNSDYYDIDSFFANFGDAGFDLRYCGKNPITVRVDNINKLETGLKFAIPENYAGIIMERSGLGVKYGLSLRARVVDSGYRGEVFVVCISKKKFVINPGDKIAQILFTPVLTEIKIVEELDITERNEKGFGSSDEKAI